MEIFIQYWTLYSWPWYIYEYIDKQKDFGSSKFISSE